MSILQKDTTLTKIFVGGLPYHTSDDTLRQFFDKFGEIEEAVVITDRQTGKSRGYGFVTMADRIAAERACKDPNPIIDGRKANVNLAYLGAKPRTLAHDILGKRAISPNEHYTFTSAFPLGVKAVPISNGYANQLARLQPYCQQPTFLTAAGPTALALPGGTVPAPIQHTTSPTSPATHNGTLSLDYTSGLGYQSYPVIYGYESLSAPTNGHVIGIITPNGSIVPVSMAAGNPATYTVPSATLTGITPQQLFPVTNATCYQQHMIQDRIQ